MRLLRARADRCAARAAAAVHVAGVEQRADVAQAARAVAERAAVDGGRCRWWARSGRGSSAAWWSCPAPFGPRNPVTCPGRTVKVRPLTAVVLAVPLGQFVDFDHAANDAVGEPRRVIGPPLTFAGSGVDRGSYTRGPMSRARLTRLRSPHGRHAAVCRCSSGCRPAYGRRWSGVRARRSRCVRTSDCRGLPHGLPPLTRCGLACSWPLASVTALAGCRLLRRRPLPALGLMIAASIVVATGG